MSKQLRTISIFWLSIMLTACLSDIQAPLPETVPAPPDDSAAEVFEYDGIINQNIQNLLCNSVLHAKQGHQDQAAFKLEKARYEKLVKLYDKGDITTEQYTSLDTWIGDLMVMLEEDFPNYRLVERTFPFSCSGMDEESEAVGEVVELNIEDDVVNANRFMEKICHTVFAKEDALYADAAVYLVEATVIAADMLLNNEVTDYHKQHLEKWIQEVSVILVTEPANVASTFECTMYEATYSPINALEPVKDILHDILDAADGLIDDVVNIVGSIF